MADQKARFAVDTEVETTLKRNRMTVLEKIRAFERFETLKELKQADQKRQFAGETSAKPEDARSVLNQKQQKPAPQFRPPQDTIGETQKMSAPLLLPEPEKVEEDSSDIELERKPVSQTTLKQQLEQMHNQLMMEREDRGFGQKQKAELDLKTQTRMRDFKNRERLCRSVYDELLDGVVGPSQADEVKQMYDSQKAVLEQDLFEHADCEVYHKYVHDVNDKWKDGKIFAHESAFQDKYDPVQSHLKQLNEQLNGDTDFCLRLADRAKLNQDSQNIFAQLGLPQIILVGSDDELQLKNVADYVSNSKADYIDFAEIDDTFIQSCKQEYQSFLDQVKNVQNYLKGYKPVKGQNFSPQKQVITINDRNMIYPLEPDKFAKALSANQVTPEQILISRLNYILLQHCKTFAQIVIDLSGVTAFMTSNKLADYAEFFSITFNEQIILGAVFIINKFKVSKNVIDFEVLLQFVLNFKIKLLQQLVPADKKDKRPPSRPSDGIDIAEATQLFNSYKTSVDAQNKAKNQMIYKSVFEKIIFIMKPKAERIELKNQPKDVKKGQKVDDPEQILQDKTIFDITAFADYQLVDVVDDFQQLAAIYKNSDVKLQQQIFDDFRNSVLIDFNKIEQFDGDFKSQQDFSDLFLSNIKNQLLNLIGNSSEFPELVKLLNEQQKQQLLYQVVTRVSQLSVLQQNNCALKLQNALKTMALRGLHTRETGLQFLMQNLEIFINEIQQDLQEQFVEIKLVENPAAAKYKEMREAEKAQQQDDMQKSMVEKITLSLEQKKQLRLTENLEARIERLSKPTKPRSKYVKPKLLQVVTAAEFNATRPIKQRVTHNKLLDVFDNQMRTQLENQAHFFRQETSDQLQEIISEKLQFVDLKSTFELLCANQLYEQEEKVVIENFTAFTELLNQYFDANLTDLLLQNSNNFSEIMTSQFIVTFQKLLFFTALPFIVFAKLKQEFNLGETEQNIVDVFFSRNVTEQYFEQHSVLQSSDVGQFVTDLMDKFLALQQSQLLKQQSSQIVLILQQGMSNPINRLKQQLEHLYLLILQSIADNCKQFQGVKLLFDAISQFSYQLEQEHQQVTHQYTKIKTELKQLSPDLELLPQFTKIFDNQKIVSKIDQSYIQQVTTNNQFENQEKYSKLEKYDETVSRFFGMELQFIEQIPDPNPKAKKGSTIPQVSSQYYFIPLLQSIKQHSLFNLQEYQNLIQIVYQNLKLELQVPKRPASGVVQQKAKGKVQEVVEVYTPVYLKFQETPEYDLMQKFIVKNKIFEDQSIEFNREFIKVLFQSTKDFVVEKTRVHEFIALWLMVLAYDADQNLFMQKINYGLCFQQPLKSFVKYQQILLQMLQLNLYNQDFVPPRPDIQVVFQNWQRAWFQNIEALKTELDQIVASQEPPKSASPAPRPGSASKDKLKKK